MAIKNPLMFITVEEFKESNYFNNTLFDDITTPDNDIWLAITQASDCVNYASGNNISTKWPEEPPTEFTDIVQTATAHQVRFILGKGVDYMRAQASIAQGGITYQQTNPNDPFYIVPEVYINLSKIKERLTFQGFPINVKPYRSNSFLSGSNDNNAFESYLRITNLQSNDPRTKIIKTNPSGIIGTIVTLDTNNIKGLENLTTEELFQQYFSNDEMQLVDGKQGQQEKVISISDEVGKLIESKQPLLTTNNAGDNITITGNGTNVKINATGSTGDSLWKVDPNSPNVIMPKTINGFYPIVTTNGKRLVYIADPEQPQDAVNLRTLNKNIPDLSEYYKKEEVDKKLDNKLEKKDFSYAFVLSAVGAKNPTLETTNKTVVGAINELKEKTKDKKFSNEYFKYNTETNEITLHDEENSLLCKDLLENNEYKILKTQNKKLLQAINEILEKQSSSSKWKDVVISDRETIIYELKANTFYRIFYDVNNKRSTDLIGKYPCLISEFYWIYTDGSSFNDLWINVPYWKNGNLSHLVIVINQHKISWKNNYNAGNLWKLQELQGGD